MVKTIECFKKIKNGFFLDIMVHLLKYNFLNNILEIIGSNDIGL